MLADGQLALPGGGTVGWCEWGDPGGRPLVLLHGTPGSRFFLADPEGGSSAGLRVLTFDRPGYGLSTPPVPSSLARVVEIVGHLADERGLDRFPVVGFSGGVPYALACGAMLESRVTRVAAVSGGGPVDELPDMYASLSEAERNLLTEIRNDPAGATERLWELARWYAETPLRLLDTTLDGPDGRVLDDPDVRSNVAKSNLEGARQGQAGLVADWIADALPWGFALADIATPVEIWVGERDPARPPLDARQIARLIPRCSMHSDPESGHWLLMTHWRQIVEAALA